MSRIDRSADGAPRSEGDALRSADETRSRRTTSSLVSGGLPRKVLDHRVVLFGAGCLGSRVADHLLRLGMHDLVVIDPDVVESKDLVQGAYRIEHVGLRKVDAVAAIGRSLDARTRVHGAAASCERIGPGLLRGAGVVVAALDRLSTRIAAYHAAHRAGIAYLDVAVDGTDGRVTEIAAPGGACLHCQYASEVEADSMGRAEQALAGEIGCRAAADPDRPTIAAPYAVAEVAAATVGRVGHVLAGRGRVFEGRLLWGEAGFSVWREFALEPLAGCPTCRGRGFPGPRGEVGPRGESSPSGEAGGGSDPPAEVVILEGVGAAATLEEIERAARERLGEGRIERPRPWSSFGEEPPRRVWAETAAGDLGLQFAARIRFERSDGETTEVELDDRLEDLARCPEEMTR